ncbi:hypothetical protein JHK82_023093 [Glycine max]|uniref:Uncharacterized protein n=2 Tax=Glycine subgen. Soja TaxID=1462606 RepID=A0A0R0J1G3_SOYBN|nr:hypothetical protein JHK82_023093 [Glycine max]KAH1054011.1 hypothetical protein GYH30_022996 [Glycine max]KRH46101.1 hypothetical protein GLYMA_08G312200v4 [Glycine max]RZB99710.1 hypothetical protein D0Y65_022214 [Glycine soja]
MNFFIILCASHSCTYTDHVDYVGPCEVDHDAEHGKAELHREDQRRICQSSGKTKSQKNIMIKIPYGDNPR